MKKSLLATLIFLAGVSQAFSATQVFRNEADYLAALGEEALLESFEGVPATNIQSGTEYVQTDAFTLTCSDAGTKPAFGVFNRPNANCHATDGNNYVVAFNGVARTFNYNFNESIRAFGLKITDFGDYRPRGYDIFLRNENGENHRIAVAMLPDGNELFFGIITDTPFTQATIYRRNGGDGFGMDGIYYALAEPPVPFTNVYTSKADFLAALGSDAVLESFENVPATNVQSGTEYVQTDAFTLTCPDAGTSSYAFGVFNQSNANQHATNGNNYIVVFNGVARTFNFNFNTNIRAFGLMITDFGDYPPSGYDIFLQNENGENRRIAVAPLPDGNEMFFGIITNVPFYCPTIYRRNGGDGIGIDEVYYAVDE